MLMTQFVKLAAADDFDFMTSNVKNGSAKKGSRVTHHLCRESPILLLFLTQKKMCDSSAHLNALRGRLAETLELLDRSFRKAVHGVLRALHRWHCFLQLGVSFGLDLSRVTRELVRLFRLDVCRGFLDSCFLRRHGDVRDEYVGRRLFLRDLDHLYGKVILKPLDARLH